jgi:hypothetical protein
MLIFSEINSSGGKNIQNMFGDPTNHPGMGSYFFTGQLPLIIIMTIS